MRRAGFVLLIAAALACAGLAKPEIKERDVQNAIKYLASDKLGGRLSVSPGFQMASDYSADQFKRAHLKPMGTDGYFVPFEMTAGTRVGKDNVFFLSAGRARINYKLGMDFMPVPGGRNNKLASGPLAFIGHGIDDDDYKDYAGFDVKDKVVIMMTSRPDGIFGGSVRGRVDEVAKKGAVGVILVSPDPKREDKVSLNGLGVRVAADIPVVQVTRAAIERVLGDRKIVDLAAAINQTKKPNPFDVPDAKARLMCDVSANKGMARDVVGLLEGNDPALKDQIIVVGGHLDHLGYGQVSPLDQNELIHPGADDNASGAVGAMMLAKYYSQAKTNRRSILFMNFAGEEEGLLGSAYFVNHPTIDLSKVDAMVNLDMIGRLKDNKLEIEGVGSSPLWPDWIDKLDADGMTITKNRSAFGGSDHTSFYGKKIPVVFLFTGIHPDYHRATDTWDKINYPGEVKVLNYAVRMIDKIDQYDPRIAWQDANTRVASAPSDTGSGDQARPSRQNSRIRVGLVPDYTFGGPGLRLSGTTPGTPAEKAGLKEGDIILKWDEMDIADMNGLMEAFMKAKPGVAVKLLVQRGAQKLTITVTPEANEQRGG